MGAEATHILDIEAYRLGPKNLAPTKSMNVHRFILSMVLAIFSKSVILGKR